jgi:hypothetical protein
MRYAMIFVLTLVGCAHEEEVTPLIHVVPGAAARASWLDWPSGKNLPPSEPQNAKSRAGGEEDPQEERQDEAPENVSTK